MVTVSQGRDLCEYAARHENNYIEDDQPWLHLDHLRLVLTVHTHVPALTCAIRDLVASIGKLTLVPVYDCPSATSTSTGEPGWNWNSDVWLELRDSLAQACGQQLQALECFHVGGFAVTWVTAIVQSNGRSLQRLHLHYATLYGTLAQFAAFYQCLEEDCSALKHVRFTKCRLWDDRGAASFDSLVRALAHVSTLESLELQKDDETRDGRQVDQSESSGRLTALGAWLTAPSPQAPVASAFATSPFTRLELTGGFWLDDKCIADLARALQSNNVITHLTLNPIVAMGAGTDALALMLLANRCLQCLRVHLAGTPAANNLRSSINISEAARGRQSIVRKNSTASSSSAAGINMITPTQMEQWMVELASILTVNTTLQQLHVTHDDQEGELDDDAWTPRVQQAFAKVLEADNVTLEQVTVQSQAQAQGQATWDVQTSSKTSQHGKDKENTVNTSPKDDVALSTEANAKNKTVNDDDGANDEEYRLGYYLHLNQRGRRTFIQNINDTDWDDTGEPSALLDSNGNSSNIHMDRDQRDVNIAKQTWVRTLAGSCITPNTADLERECYDLSCLFYFFSNTPLEIWQDAISAASIQDESIASNKSMPRKQAQSTAIESCGALSTANSSTSPEVFQGIAEEIYSVQHELALQQIQHDCKAEVRQMKHEHAAQLADLQKEHTLDLKCLQVKHETQVSMLEVELEQMRALVDASGNNKGVEGHRKRLERFRRESQQLGLPALSKNNRRATTTAIANDLELRDCQSMPSSEVPFSAIVIGVPPGKSDGKSADKEHGGESSSATLRETRGSPTDAALFPEEMVAANNSGQSLDYLTEDE